MSDLMSRKRFRITFVVTAALIAVLFGAVPDARAQAGQAGAVRVTTYVIEASNGVPSVDSEIRHIVKQFHGTFRYSTYKLISKVPKKIPIGGNAKITLPGLRILDISALGYESGRIKLKIKIIQKSTSGRPKDILSTEFRLVKGGTIILGDYNYHKGKLILAVSADM